MLPGMRKHRLDIKLMEPTVFSVAPLTINGDVDDLKKWLAESGLRHRMEKEPWRFYTKCTCKPDRCPHYVIYLRFHTKGEAMLFKMAWM